MYVYIQMDIYIVCINESKSAVTYTSSIKMHTYEFRV
jgi:hypothetical protein